MVQFDANYMGPVSSMTDFPDYQQDYARVSLMQGASFTQDVLVPKEDADATFALKAGERVRVVAYAQPVAAQGVFGGQQNQLMFICDQFFRSRRMLFQLLEILTRKGARISISLPQANPRGENVKGGFRRLAGFR